MLFFPFPNLGLFPGGSQMTIPRHRLSHELQIRTFILPPSLVPNLGDPCRTCCRGGSQSQTLISQAQDWAEEGSWGRGAKVREHIQVLSGQGRHPGGGILEELADTLQITQVEGRR